MVINKPFDWKTTVACFDQNITVKHIYLPIWFHKRWNQRFQNFTGNDIEVASCKLWKDVVRVKAYNLKIRIYFLQNMQFYQQFDIVKRTNIALLLDRDAGVPKQDFLWIVLQRSLRLLIKCKWLLFVIILKAMHITLSSCTPLRNN